MHPFPDGEAPGLGVRFVATSAVLFALAAAVMTWPLATDLGAHYTSRGDFYQGVWNLEWVARVLSEPELELFETRELYFPSGTGLHVQPLSPLNSFAAAPLTLLFGPVVAFNALVLFSFWFAGFVTSLWVKAFSGRELAGLFAGAVFTFAPYHYTYLAELNLVAIGVIPLYLLARLHLDRRPTSSRAALAGAALAASGLASWYYGLVCGLLALAASARSIARSGIGWPGQLRVEVVGFGTCALLLSPIAIQLAPAFIDPVHAPGHARPALAPIIDGFKETETSLALWSYAGLATLLLAAIAVGPLRRNRTLLVWTLVFVALSLGRSLSLGGLELPLPFALVDSFPVLREFRYADRFFVAAELGLAALAGLGACRLLDSARLDHPGLRGLVACALGVVLLADLYPGTLRSVSRVDALPIEREGSPGAVFHVPTRYRNWDGEMMFHQTRHRRPISGGFLTRRQPAVLEAFLGDPVLGPLLQARPGRLPADLAAGLRERGFGFVSLQRRALVEGSPRRPLRVWGPFSLGGPEFLRQRLFPVYPIHREVRELSSEWERELRRVLGEPVDENAHAVVFALSPAASGVGASALP